MGPTSAPTALAAVSPAYEADAADARGEGFGSITLGEGEQAEHYEILHEPPMLMMSDMARVDSGSEAAAATLAELFEYTLGDEAYLKFKRQLYRERLGNDELMRCMRQIIEKTLGRPTR